MKVYLLYYDFKSTSGNHAGMAYLARYISSAEKQVKLIRHFPQEYRGGKYVGYLYSIVLTLYLMVKLKKEDKVFFLEYATGHFAYQEKIAQRLRSLGKKNLFLGMVHLSGSHLLDIYKEEKTILTKLMPLSSVVVMGNSLKSFIEKIGYPKPVILTFHYVDTEYYRPISDYQRLHNKLNVIFVGNIKRKFSQLTEVVKSLPVEIHFHICLGNSKDTLSLELLPNVTLHGFLAESELLKLMQQCDVNLAVLEDTVGSNAITCSMATGLVQVVSDVGSIRDYCNNNNAFFCSSNTDFTQALMLLSKDRARLKSMQDQTVKRAHELSKEIFLKEFLRLIDK